MDHTSTDPFLTKGHTLQEIAEWLPCHPDFLRDEIKRGRLRAHRLTNRCLRILPADLRAWLAAGETVSSKRWTFLASISEKWH